MIDPAVELEQHPGRVGPPGQQLSGALDQVGEVQPAPLLLGRVVERDIGGREVQRGEAVLGHPGGLDPVAGVAEALLLAGQPGQDPGVEPLGPEPRLGLARLGAEHPPEVIEAGPPLVTGARHG